MLARKLAAAVTGLGIVISSVAAAFLAMSDGPTVEPVTTTSSGVEKLELWTPSHVDAPVLPLSFSLPLAQPETLQISLQFKKSEEKDYSDATLVGKAPTYTANAGAGTGFYSLKWNKEADRIPAGAQVDLLMKVSLEGGRTLQSEIRNLKFEERRAIRNRTDSYLIYYGKWDDPLIETARANYPLVILDTRTGITPEQVARIRAGKDPADASDDVLVLGYLSVGEDLRTAGLSPEEMKGDPRFVLDGSGPSVDPRKGAPFPNGSALPVDMDIRGNPTNGGYAPFYLNDNFRTNGSGQAGVPDINAYFKAAFVNPGHPEWLAALTDMTLAKDKVSGIRELLTYDYGQGFGLDGLFMDTLDTAAPNYFTSSTDVNQGEFEWVAWGTRQLVQNIRQAYPDTMLLANRGLFFYHPDQQAYAYTLRGLVDYVLFESYRLDSSPQHWFHEPFHMDNKFNYVQKVLAEADRPDGFRLLSLGYAEGPGGELAKKALHGDESDNVGRSQLLEDIKETGELGMVHYLTDASVADINTFVKDHRYRGDLRPRWGSTLTPSFGEPAGGPRTGIQKVDIRGKDVFALWDVAHSGARPVTYTLYIKEKANFQFGKDLEGQSAKVVKALAPSVPAKYAGSGDRAGRYPYEAKVEGLVSGTKYYLLLRAANALGEYEANEVTLSVVAP